MQAPCCESEGQTAQLVHLFLPYDPQLHLQTAQISVHQFLSSPKPISDLVSASVQSGQPEAEILPVCDSPCSSASSLCAN